MLRHKRHACPHYLPSGKRPSGAGRDCGGAVEEVVSGTPRQGRNQVAVGKQIDPSPAGAWPPPSPIGEGWLLSNVLSGQKVLRYEADEGSLGPKARRSTYAPKCLQK